MTLDQTPLPTVVVPSAIAVTPLPAGAPATAADEGEKQGGNTNPGPFIPLTTLSSVWKGFLVDNDQAKDQVHKDLHIPEFYISHGAWEFYMGTGEDNLRSLLLTEGQVRAVKAELESNVGVALPGITFRKTFADIESVFIPDQDAFRVVKASLAKHNKVYKQQQRQQQLRQLLETSRELRRAGTHVFIALDVEAWERDQSRVLEVGWSMYDSRRDRYLDQHHIVSEFRHLHNGRYVADQRDNFVFGTSQWATLREIAAAVQQDLDMDAPLVFIGHAVSEDIHYLKTLGVNVPGTAITLDTAKLYCAITGSAQTTSLGKMLDALDIEHYFLHNAGNDAHYTLEAFLALTK